MLGAAALPLVIPDLLGQLAELIGEEGNIDELNRLGVALTATMILSAFLNFFRQLIFVRITASSLTEIRQKAYNHIIMLPMKFFMNRSISELSSRISADTQVLKHFINNSMQELISGSVTILGGTVMLFLISWKLTVLIFVCAPVLYLLSKRFGKRISRASSDLQDDVAHSNIIVQESLVDIFSVKSFSSEDNQKKRFKKTTDAVTLLDIRLGVFTGKFSLYTELVISLMVIICIWAAAFLVQSGELLPGKMMSYALYMVTVLMSLVQLSDVFSEIQKGLGSIRSLLKVLEEPIEELGEKTEVRLSGSLCFENVSFSYPGAQSRQILKNISFTIPTGERWALVGSSGSGKSTIATLILQMYPLEEGQICFDKQRMDELSIADIRKHIGVVPQSSTLFSSSIKDNILFGNPEATEEELMEIAREASVDEFVKELPGGYEAQVGEHGMRLSGGQRQRILLTRAMLKNPKILILDEATSALDNETEMLVQNAIHALTERCTSLIIAHRLSTVQNADHILVLERGEIVEEGSYDELMANEHSHFRHLNFLNPEASEHKSVKA